VANFDIDLSFVADDDLRKLAEDYHRQAVASYKAQAYLGTLVACGGVLEGLLAWALLSKGEEAAQRYPEKPIEQWDLSKLIGVAKDVDLIGETAKTAAWAVKEFRNLIHPYNLIRGHKSARPDEALALNALSAVMEITRSLGGRLRVASAEERQRATPAPVESEVTRDSTLAKKSLNFAWLEEGRIAGCRGPRSDTDLSMLRSLGIRALVRLAPSDETDVMPDKVRDAGLDDCHEPIADFEPPTQNQIHRVVAFMDTALSRGSPVAVSCGAGYGRTGTLLACYLVGHGASADEAMETVHARAGRGPETDEQVAAIRQFQARLKRQPS
jgi:atypical dual specificity phosphatase